MLKILGTPRLKVIEISSLQTGKNVGGEASLQKVSSHLSLNIKSALLLL